MAIQGFKCADTQELFETDRSRQFGSIRKPATRNLGMLDAAATLKDLKAPPGNRLEALTRDRAGQHSIRINDQWRSCFDWTEAGPNEGRIPKHHHQESRPPGSKTAWDRG